MITGTKPLYQFERDINYNKHKQRLKLINTRSSSNKKTDRQSRSWVKESFKKQISKEKKKIEQENQKLLEKLVDISTKNKLSAPESIKHRDNPYRRNWLKNIKKQNQQLGDKLLHLRSSLEYNKITKSIEDYQKVKRSMMINRKAKLPHLMTKSIAKKSLPTHNHCAKNLQSIDIPDLDVPDQAKMRYKTETNQ